MAGAECGKNSPVELTRKCETNAASGANAGAPAKVVPDEESGWYYSWLRRSLHAGMPCLTETAALKSNPALALPGAESIVMLAVPYPGVNAGEPDLSGAPAFPAEIGANAESGLVARYACGRDYHRAVGTLLKRITRMLAARFPGEHFRAFCDTLPLSERACALKAGLGFILQSGLLANEYFGTRFVLGGILTTLPLAGDMPDAPTLHSISRERARKGDALAAMPEDGDVRENARALRNNQDECTARRPQGESAELERMYARSEAAHSAKERDALAGRTRLCGNTCAFACVRACPASALSMDANGGAALDISRCLAWLSIEYKGVIERERWHQFGDRIFGCDICQDVCPHNAQTNIRNDHAAANDALFASANAAGARLSLSEVLSIRDQAAFVRRFSGTALMRAGRRGLVRNAIIAASNTRCASASPLIASLREDADEVIAETAKIWYASQSLL